MLEEGFIVVGAQMLAWARTRNVFIININVFIIIIIIIPC